VHYKKKRLPFLNSLFFYIFAHGKEHQIFGIRAIIEAIKQNYSRQSLYSKKRVAELMKDLMKVMKRV
jgi:glycosyltransferase involved in cell wall biosynthesis